MNRIFRNGIVLPLALGTLLATSFGAAAARDKDRAEQRQDNRDQRQERRAEQRQERKEHRQERRQEQRQVRTQERRAVPRQVTHRDLRQDRNQERREIRQDRRDARHDIRQDRREHRQDIRQDRREHRRDFRHDRREHRQDLRQARRAHERYRADYQRRLRALQARHYTPRWYHSGNYRYFRGGQWYRVNYYGADILRRAIDQGYREGLRAGRADRYDGWRGGYRSSGVWIDASFGYVGNYVSRSEYNYYFRQGFERGYQDGYYGHYRYGRPVNGEVIIIDAVLRAILDLQRWG